MFFSWKDSSSRRDRDQDGNWLMVRLGADTRVGPWAVTQPCLLAWELMDLVEATGKAAMGLMDGAVEVRFIEPNITFFLRPWTTKRLR